MNESTNEIAANHRINDSKVTTTRFLEYKTQLIERTPDNNNTLDKGVVVPLKYLSKYWRSSDLPLINCDLTCLI